MTTKELAAFAGITERMLRWWVDRGIVKARQPCAKRRSEADHERGYSRTCLASNASAQDDGSLPTAALAGLPMAQLRRWKLLPARGDYLIVMGGRVHWFAERGLIQRLERAPRRVATW
jgi:hypothetical protein